MTKLSRRNLSFEDMGNYINNLWAAFTLANSKEDIKELFKDLFSHTEYKMFAKRFEVARLLLNGEKYEAIEKKMFVTSVTISKISNILVEKGEGLRRAIVKVNKLENRYLSEQKERTLNLENPLRQRTKRKTLLGAALKVGIEAVDKSISDKLRENSAKKKLTI